MWYGDGHVLPEGGVEGGHHVSDNCDGIAFFVAIRKKQILQSLQSLGIKPGTAVYYYLRPPHCSVPFVPHAKFTRPQFTGPAFVNPWIAIGLRVIERIAEDPRTWVWGQGSNLRPRIAIQVQSEWAQFRSNRCANCLNCFRIAKKSESNRNRPDCKYQGLDCGRIATTQKSSFRDCGSPRGLPRTLKLASRSALESGLIPDQQPLG